MTVISVVSKPPLHSPCCLFLVLGVNLNLTSPFNSMLFMDKSYAKLKVKNVKKNSTNQMSFKKFISCQEIRRTEKFSRCTKYGVFFTAGS